MVASQPLARCTLLAVALAAPVASPAQDFASRTLENGLEVVVVPRSKVPFATVQIAFRGGAFTQTSESMHGLPHLLEHMLFQQEERAFSTSLSKRISDLDAAWNAVTAEETVRYYFTVPAKNTVPAIEVLGDMVRKVNFSEKALEAEKRVVRGELERRAAEPTLLLLTTADRQLWTDAGWARKNAGGNLLSVNDASLQRLRTLYETYYVPNNAILIVTGDVDADAAFAAAEKSFGSWKQGDDPMAQVVPLAIPPLEGISREYVTGDVRDVTFLIRWHGPSALSQRDATYAADVFSGIVNLPISGTQKRLVDSGLFESVSMSYTTRRFVGQIELFARTTPEKAGAAAGALGRELRQLVAADYFSVEDIELARKRQRVFRAFATESAAAVNDFVADFWTSVDLNYYRTYFDQLESRGPTEVSDFVNTFLKGRNFAVTVLLSQETQQEVGTRLRNSINAWRVP